MHAQYSIDQLCATLSVTRNGFHAWVGRQPGPRAFEDQRAAQNFRVGMVSALFAAKIEKRNSLMELFWIQPLQNFLRQ
jgi:hypothetical protein